MAVASSYRKTSGKRHEIKPETLVRRERFKQLAQRIASMDKTEREELASRCPVATIEGKLLSPRNMCMVALQFPSATIVGGFRQWIKAGRVVRKGEKGLMILCPSARKVDAEAAASVGIDPESAPDQVYFVAGTVFDVSQTDELHAEQSAAAA